MSKYKVLKEYENEGVVLESGAEFETDADVSTAVADGTLELVVEKTPEELEAEEKAAKEKAELDASDKSKETDVQDEQKPVDLHFKGKLIISDTTREVEGKVINHIRLEDGTEQDLTAEEYQAVLDAAKNK